MPNCRWVLILFLIALVGCAKRDVVSIDDAACRLRLVEFASKKPIVTTSVTLIPRVILLKAKPGAPNPNLEYALTLATDENGILYLDETKLRKLFGRFSTNGNVDCNVKGFSRFLIGYNSISEKYSLTVFDKNNRVRSSDAPFLVKGKVVELFLDKLL